MKIRNIHIDGFGQFAGREFGPFEQPVTVFYGPNEAGKSTLLEFIRTILFGFKPRSGRVPRGGRPNDYAPLSGGRHGGRITLINGDGQQSVIERFRGGRAGQVTVRDEAGRKQGETVLAELLGSHSRAIFDRIFAFALNELYSHDLLHDSNVNSQIYSAGMGISSLPNTMKSIESERRDIFLKRGSSQKIYEVYSKLREVDSRLEEVAHNAARFGSMTVRLQMVDAELEGVAEERLRTQSRYSRWTRLKNAWDDWNDLISAKQELAGLPVIENFPTNGVSRLETLEDRVRTAQQEYDFASHRVTEAEGAADVRIEQEDILQHSSAIDRLQNRRSAFDSAVKDLTKLETELAQYKNHLDETLKKLGPGWDETRLQGFELSITSSQEISEHGKELRRAYNEHSSRQSTLVQDTTALEEAIEAENKARREFESAGAPSLDVDQLRQRRNLIRVTRSHLNEVSRHKQNVSNLQSQLEGLESKVPTTGVKRGSKAITIVSLVIGIVVLIIGAILVEMAVFIGIAAGLTLAIMAVFIYRRSGLAVAPETSVADSIRESLRSAEAEVKELQSEMMQGTAPLGLDMIDEPSLLAAQESLDDENGLLQSWTQLSKTLVDAKDLTVLRQHRVEKSKTAVEEAEKQLAAERHGWQEWLRANSLPDTFRPETAELLQGQVKLGRSQLGNVRSWQQRIKAIEKNIETYIRIVEPLALAFDATFDQDEPRTVAAAADTLVERFGKVRSRIEDRSKARAQLEEARRQLERRRSELQKAGDGLKQLLRVGDVEDAEDFRTRAGLSERRTGLDEQIRSARGRLQRLSGPGKPLKSLTTDLRTTNAQAIDDEIGKLEEELTNVDSKNTELLIERGRIQSKLEGLIGEEESSRLRMERNVLIEQLRDHARDWTRLTLARNLLEEARSKFERERQPGVVRHAEKFFADITEGRYRRVYAPLGEQTITVTDADRRAKDPSELSRGTREQLFLSLRFGLIRELGQRTKPFPVVVDEVLVNFDPQRALRAAIAFLELSRTNQVLVFTCHPTVVELFRRAASDAVAEAPEVVEIA